MTELTQTEFVPFRLDASRAPALDARPLDALIAFVTFAASLAVLAYSLRVDARFPLCLLMHVAVLALPLGYLAIRARQNTDLTVPYLLLIATAATGPIGAIGCAAMALSLWSRHPSPSRLQQWYDYISGVTVRSRVAHLYDELEAGRLPTDPVAKVPRFTPILQGDSLEDQQRVLGVIGRRYHADFRTVLRRALRNRNGFIRAQAAAVASGLSPDEKGRLWSGAPPGAEPAASGRDPAAPNTDTRRP
jgi:hypothetical protein